MDAPRVRVSLLMVNYQEVVRAMRLSGALDNDVLVVTRKLLAEGVPAEPEALWTALHRSNSSLKRRPKRVLLSTLERVLHFLGLPDRPDEHLVPDRPDDDDDDDEMDYKTQDSAPVQAMNRSLRAHLAPTPTPGPPPGSSAEDLPADERRRRQHQRMANGEPLPKRAKTTDQSGPAPTPPTDVSLSDLGGIDPIIDQLSNLLIRPLLCPHVYARMRVALPKGILLHGPPGCGKTLIARAFAASLALPFVEILGPSIVSGMSGESEKGVRDRFEEAKRNAPCLLFLDEIDAIAPKRETSQSGMEKRIVTQLLVSMDELDRDPSRPVIVLATTNRPDSLDPALRRGGRFDTEINIPVPNEHVRERILRAQTRHTPVADDVDFPELAKRTAGFVGADLKDLVGKAGTWQLERFFERLERPGPDPVDPAPPTTAAQRAERRIVDLRTHDLATLDYDPISMAAFAATLPTIVPSSKREGFATIPDVSWDDIGALQRVREELHAAIVDPIRRPHDYAAVGISAPAGVLLWGPPGCGKTLLAKAVAAESQANFIAVKGPELLNKFVGESEAAVRRVFARARSSVPCVIFFDELDALVPRRDDAASDASARVVNTLLTELDGLSERTGIYVIGATNRPDVIDDAMLRPGRLETPLFVDLPGPQERVDIFRALLRGKPVDDLDAVAEVARTAEGYSGADLGALLRQAGQGALRRGARRLETGDFVAARAKVKKSVADPGRWRRLAERFGGM